jgi:zinc protease
MKYILHTCRFILLFLVLAPYHLYSADDQILRETLQNGLRVVIVKSTLAPVVTTEVNYLAGSNETPDGFPGMAHAQEHMMFRGSPGMTAGQLSHIIALMGGNFNADTQQTVTQYYLTVPKDNLDVALRIEATRMSGVLDTDELWNQERGAIEQEVAQDLSNPEYLFFTKLIGHMFAGTPYEHDALGTRPSFQKTTGAMLKQFYDSWYGPNNAILIITGDIDSQQTMKKVREIFGHIPKRKIPARASVVTRPLEPANIAMDTDSSYGTSIVAFRMPGYDSPDFAAGQILADVLNSRRSELYTLVTKGKAMFTGFSGDTLPRAGYGYALAGFPQGGDGQALVVTLKEIIAGYARNGVPPGLVEASKRHEITDAEFQKNSIAGLAATWSQALAVEGRNSPDDDINALKQVTVEDVNRVARQYLVTETAITAVLTPRSSGRAVSSKKGFGGGESFAPAKTQIVKLPAWAEKAAQLPQVPVSMVKPAVIHLSNRILLIVQYQSVSPTITVAGGIKSNPDMQMPAGKDGVHDILASLFTYGTTSLDRVAFQKALDDIGADISTGTFFSLHMLSEHFERGIELLADNLLHPALPEQAFAIVKQETAAAAAGELQSPGHHSQQALRRGLYPQGDPKLREITPETVNAVTLQDIKAYYRTVFRPDMTTIVIVGPITPEQARNTVERFFGSWLAEGKKPETDYPFVLPNKASSSIVPDTSRVQDQVTLAQTVGITRSHPDYYCLELSNRVLSGAFYASRLYRDLRENAGLVYTVESFLQAEKTRTVFGVLYACDPPNVSRARNMLEQELNDLQKKPISEHELRQTQTLLLRQIPLSESSIDGIANGLLIRSLKDLPLNEPRLAAEIYLKITTQKVREAFARWIRPKDFVQVTVGPPPE